MVINVYQGFEDVKLYRSAKFRKSPLKSTTQNDRPVLQTVTTKKKLSTIKQGGAVATLLLPPWQWGHDAIRSAKPEGEQ